MTQLNWRRIKPLENANAVNEFEKKYGFSLPADLKDCIMRNNAGRPSKNLFVVGNGVEFEIKSLLSYNENDTENVYNVIGYFIEKYGHSMLPFALDSGNNYYCVKDNKIILWTQDGENILPVCNSWTEMENLLKNSSSR